MTINHALVEIMDLLSNEPSMYRPSSLLWCRPFKLLLQYLLNSALL